MSRIDRQDPSDEREIGTRDIHEETDCCCVDGACDWRKNTPAQSEEETGGHYPSAPGGDD